MMMTVLGWTLGWLLLGRARRLPTAPVNYAPRSEPTVSVVIPARNEEHRLPRLLDALRADPSPAREVIVVDDGSSDHTATLAARAGVRVMSAGELPAGWTGKAHACSVGARAATGDVLLFLDADVVPGPGTVGALAARAWRIEGLVSRQPWHRIERPYEALSAMPNVVAILGAGRGRGHPRWWERPAAYGPALAVPRSVYEAFGGHGAVRGSVVDDIALAQAASSAGWPVEASAGGRNLTYRMYPEGWRSLVEGWSKNLLSGAAAIAPLRSLAVAVWVTAALVSGFGVVGAAPAATVAYVAFATQAAVMLRRAGRFVVLAPVYPLLLLAFVGLCGLSVLARVRGQAQWRSRSVSLRREAP